MATINKPTTLHFNHEDTIEAIRQAVIKKQPELEEEEFEMEFSFDSYAKLLSVRMQVL
jgi:hypothetical protein